MEKTIIPCCLFIFLLVPEERVIGPEGYKLLITFLIIVVIVLSFVIRSRLRKNKKYTRFRIIKKKVRVETELSKNRVYFPDFLTLTIKNTGKADVDIDRPLLVFESLFMKRNFRIKGTDGYHFYPLYLESGKTHNLRIDLSRFYQHDKHLKRFPKVSVTLFSVQGKKLGRRSVMLRKTLFR